MFLILRRETFYPRTTMKCRSWALPAFLFLSLASGGALAQDNPPADTAKGADDPIEADIQAGRFKDACPAIKRKYLEDPRPATLYRLATCFDAWGRIATAAVHYDDYLAAYEKLPDSEQQEKAERERENKASKRRQELEKEIPKVILRVPRDAPDTTQVKRRPLDDGPLVPVAIGVPLPIDPGDHVLTTEVPGRVSVFTKFSLKRGENKIVEVEVPPVNGRIDPTTKVKPIQPVPSLTPSLDPGISGRRVAAYSLGGIGAVGILGGVVTGAITWAQKEPIAKNCLVTNPKVCNPTGIGAKNTAGITGLVSTVAFPVGFVALATGITLYFTEPPPSKFGRAEPKVRIGATVGASAGTLEVDVRW